MFHSDLIWQFAAASIPYCLAVGIGYLLLAHDAERFWMYCVIGQLAVILVATWVFVGIGAAAGAIALGLGGAVALGCGAVYARRHRMI